MNKLRGLVENNSLYKKMSRNKILAKLINWETITYIFFGVLTTVVSYASYAVANSLFESVGYHGVVSFFVDNGKDYSYQESNVISWIFSVTFAFVTNKMWVFESRGRSRGENVREFFSFYASRIASLFIDIGFTYVFVSLFGMGKMVSKIIASVVIVVVNYILSKLFVFKKKPEEQVQSQSSSESDS